MNETTKEIPPSERLKTAWQPSYTWLLIANAAYILIFYLLMNLLD